MSYTINSKTFNAERNNTLGENVRYLMYKYNLSLDDWNQNNNNIYKKGDRYV